jgi:flavin-dependent dehydrogenase
MKKEIRIAGAGISGLTSAIVLSKAGYRVKVYERNNDVGIRFNEDFQGMMNWGFKDDLFDYMRRIGLKTDFWNTPLIALDVCGPDEYKHTFNLDRPFCYIVQRGKKERCLDQSLKQQALDSGVEIIFNRPAKEEEVDIIATGPNFDGVTDGLVNGYIFETDSPDMFSIIFNDEYAYNGYSYLLIAGGNGTIATCIFGKYDNVGEYLKETDSYFLKNYTFRVKNKRKFSGSGNFYLLKSNKKYVGEAGGFQDFLWGFGMRYAIITGYLAAKSIIENKEYEKMWSEELGGLLKTSISMRFLFSFFGKRSYKMFIRYLERHKDPISFFSRIYNPTILSKITYPFAKIYFGKYIKDRTNKLSEDGRIN